MLGNGTIKFVFASPVAILRNILKLRFLVALT
jgi:hypothetical protein